MDALKAILTRRSIRSYIDKDIPDEIINHLLNAGFSAPSAGNQQTWHFILIDEKDKLDKIIEFHRHAKMLKNANRAILVCSDLTLEKFKGYWVLDCSAATQNILLAARALNLGACWLGIYPREDRVQGLKELLNLPDSVMPHSLISLGYSNEKQEQVDRFNKERIHNNRW